MKHVKPSGTMSLLLLSAQIVYAQAITEYGKTLGGVSQRSRSANPQASKEQVRPGKGSGGFQGVGDVGGRPLAPRLIVVGQKTGLYPRQDDEAQKIEQLSQGDSLIPIVQNNGGNDWYMVKTQKGLMGWVKSTDVREDTGSK